MFHYVKNSAHVLILRDSVRLFKTAVVSIYTPIMKVVETRRTDTFRLIILVATANL